MAGSGTLDAFDERDFFSQMLDGSLACAFDPASFGFRGCDARNERSRYRAELAYLEGVGEARERDQAPGERAFLFQRRQRHAKPVAGVVSLAREAEVAPGFDAVELLGAAPERRRVEVQLLG